VRIFEKFIRPSVSTGWLPGTGRDGRACAALATLTGLGGLAVAAGFPAFVGLACLDGVVGFADGVGAFALAFFTAFATLPVFAALAVFTFAIAHRS
jgi:hypothetical protein